MDQVSENPVKNREKDFNALTVVTALEVAIYITSNVLAVRILSLFGVQIFDAGTILFPFAYMLGDVLTEVWGYRTAKKVVWVTFLCNAIFVLFTAVGCLLPFPDYQTDTVAAYGLIFGYVPRILAASLAGFLVGELLNAKAMEWIRQKTGEKHLWVRTVGSSVVGHLADTVVFVLIAFLFTAPAADLFSMIFVQYGAKLLIEAVLGTPMAYAAVALLKKRPPNGD